MPEWSADSPAARTVRRARPQTLDQLRHLMAALVSDLLAAPSDKSDLSDPSDKSDKPRVKQEVAANVMLCLINQETYLLGRQIARLAADFETDGGFTERLYRVRSEKRENVATKGDKNKKNKKNKMALNVVKK